MIWNQAHQEYVEEEYEEVMEVHSTYSLFTHMIYYKIQEKGQTIEYSWYIANKDEHDKDHEHGAFRLPGAGEDYFLAVLDCLRSKCGEQSRGHRARPRLTQIVGLMCLFNCVVLWSLIQVIKVKLKNAESRRPDLELTFLCWICQCRNPSKTTFERHCSYNKKVRFDWNWT